MRMQSCCSVGADGNWWRVQPTGRNNECLRCPGNDEEWFYPDGRSFRSRWLQQERRRRGWQRERGEYHEGVPAITVIVDGGWSKRSHKHSYNAKCGVGIIIGLKMEKLLHIGVHNKYCTACRQGIPQEQHACHKNWDASSSEMETDIILEGFKQTEQVHVIGVRYTHFIGDGDSSVYPTLIQNVPGWGHTIKKLECANHACKCYRGGLEKLVQENSSYKGKGGFTQKMRRRLTGAARCAIRMCSKESDTSQALRSLEKDLINGPLHCFGHHDHCSPDFCSTARERLQQTSASGSGKDRDDEADTHDTDLIGKLHTNSSIIIMYPQ